MSRKFREKEGIAAVKPASVWQLELPGGHLPSVEHEVHTQPSNARDTCSEGVQSMCSTDLTSAHTHISG